MMKKSRATSSKSFISLIVTQFLGAFNDNAFKLVISLYIVSMAAGVRAESRKVSIAGAVFILPFILFSTYAGCISDRYSKRSVIVFSKALEVAVMLTGAAAFYTKNLTFMFIALFLMGMQSTLFSPSKYGIIPEIVRDEELSNANGLMQMSTFLAIIFGTAVGGLLFAAFGGRIYITSIVFVLIAVIGVVTSRGISEVAPAKAGKKLELNILRSAHKTYNKVKGDRPLLLSIVAIAFFWFIGALFQLNIIVYGSSIMGLPEGRIAALLTTIAFGIGLGSLLAGRLSKERVEFGLVPIGSIGLVIFSFDLAFSYASFPRTAFDLFWLGIFSGFYIVPVTAYLQQKSAAADKGENIAFSNLLSFTGIMFASAYLYVMSNAFDVSPAGIFLTMSALTIFINLIIFKIFPELIERFVLWTFITTTSRLTVTGSVAPRKRAPVLIVSNHVSRFDALLIALACKRRVIPIVRERACGSLFMRLLHKLSGAVIVREKGGKRSLASALAAAKEALSAGSAVCVFPEGDITRTGTLHRFDDAYLKIAADSGAQIVPVYIDIPAASLFFCIKNLLSRRRASVIFGKAMSAMSGAREVRQAVSLLGSKAFKARIRRHPLLHLAFIHTAKRRFFKPFISDSLGFSLTYGKVLAAAMTFGEKLSANLKPDEKLVGIMMPTSCIASILNLSVLMSGRTPVNLNYTVSMDSIGACVTKCGIKTIYTSAKLLEKLNIKKRREMVFVEELFKEIGTKDKLKGFLKALITPESTLRKKYERGAKPGDLATVIFSSGSTGEPKGIMLTHNNIISNIEAVAQVIRLNKDDAICGILPMFHSFGFTVTLMLPAVLGLRAAYHPNPMDPANVGKVCEDNGCTILTATPTFLATYTKKCAKRNFASLRYVITGAEKLKSSVAAAFEKKFGIAPYEGYGCTELSPVVSLNVPDVRLGGGLWQRGAKSGSIGKPLPGVTVKIMDVDTGGELAIGRAGALWVKGANVMKGYLNEPAMTADVIANGWYNTGDIASIDGDGFITITDRLSRFSKIAGEMVPHLRIEDAIHEVIRKDAPVCIVTSVPDAKRGERLVVLHTPMGMEIGELWERLNAMDLPKLWIPKRNAFREIGEIPVLASGKVALGKVKEMAHEFERA